jgi:light-regulated signal transduction histidine kinase (bacteriophytochrome)
LIKNFVVFKSMALTQQILPSTPNKQHDGNLSHLDGRQISQPLGVEDTSDIAGSIQGFGAVVGFVVRPDGQLKVVLTSDNSDDILGYTPSELFDLDSFGEILGDYETSILFHEIASIHDLDSSCSTQAVFTMSIQAPGRLLQEFSCVLHSATNDSEVLICEFELQQDTYPHRHSSQNTRSQSFRRKINPERTSTRRRRSSGSINDMIGTMSRVNENLSTAPSMEALLEHVTRASGDITGYHDIMVHRFDKHWNSWKVAQSGDQHGFEYLAETAHPERQPLSSASQEMYEDHKVQVHHAQDPRTSRLLTRPGRTLANPIVKNSLYLRVLPDTSLPAPNGKMDKSYVSIPLEVAGKLWGVVTCYSHNSSSIEVSFLARGLCRYVGDLASRKIEHMRHSFPHEVRSGAVSRTDLTKQITSISAGSQDLLQIFKADVAIFWLNGMETLKGSTTAPQEGFALLEYLQNQRITEVLACTNIAIDFPDLHYEPGFQFMERFLYIPLCASGENFVVFIRKKDPVLQNWGDQQWSGNDLQYAAIIHLIYSKINRMWKQKEGALQENHLYKLLISNTNHEFRTLLNAIINYMEFATEGVLDVKGSLLLTNAKSTSQLLLGTVTRLLEFIEKDMGACYLSATGH